MYPFSDAQWSGRSFSVVNGHKWRPQADDPLHAFQGYGSVDAWEMPLELGHAGSFAPRCVNLANSFGDRIVDSKHSMRMIRP